MGIPRPVTIDFETYGLGARPEYPPLPVGVSIQYPGKKTEYLAWGHASKNNASWTQGQDTLGKAYAWAAKTGEGLLHHNGKFDVDVAETHLGMPRHKWDLYHDTLFLLFLHDPNQSRMDLKSSAERLLGMKPEERDAVAEWLIKNQPVPGVKIVNKKDRKEKHGKRPTHYMSYLAYAPGDLVGKYANGDVIRTARLFKLLYADIKRRGMLEAYQRECRLMPHLLTIERQGMPVDLKRLGANVKAYNKTFAGVRDWVVKTLKAPQELNLNSGAELVDALIKAKKIDVDRLGRTEKTEAYKTDKESMTNAVTDKRILAMLNYYGRLDTCLHTFMEPWLRTAQASKGLIFTSWNQVKGNDVGARTGRLSSTPNFQNIPKVFAPIFHHEDPKAKLPKCPIKLPRLPAVRGYVIPFPGHVLIDRDYSQQEPRILAHFDGGELMRQYQADPWADFHDSAKARIEQATGRKYTRSAIKTINLGLIYGLGIAKMAISTGLGYEETKELKEILLTLYPGLKAMYQTMKLRRTQKKPIRTWGGRENYCEPDRFDPESGRMKTYDYKLVNTLVQGSAADCTKEAAIRYMESKPDSDKLLAIVHDEGLASVPKARVKAGMECLRVAMESVEFDVKMLSEGKFSPISWAKLGPYDKKGVILK